MEGISGLNLAAFIGQRLFYSTKLTCPVLACPATTLALYTFSFASMILVAYIPTAKAFNGAGMLRSAYISGHFHIYVTNDFGSVLVDESTHRVMEIK